MRTRPRKSSYYDDLPELSFEGVYVAGKEPLTRWDVYCKDGEVKRIEPHVPKASDTEEKKECHPDFVCASLCHPHIHLDKCFLLSHPKFVDLEIETGDFDEALRITKLAKSRFEHDDLMERGRALIKESLNFGVTHMRAFVEVDPEVQFKCLKAGLALKQEFESQCSIQICVFAQDPIVSYPDRGKKMMRLLEDAANHPGVDAFGSAPYVEKNGDMGLQLKNMEFAIRTAKRFKLHLDFHMDYNLDPTKRPAVIDALNLIHRMKWPSNYSSVDFRHITFGHCTRMTLFDEKQWRELQDRVCGLPVGFVGLPTSDMFMMGRPNDGESGSQRPRGTLQVLDMIKKYALNSGISVNNVGNAFTPHGNLDPFALASSCVGIYQATTKKDTDLILQMISNRAKVAIGYTLPLSYEMDIDVGDPADFVLIHNSKSDTFRARKTVHDLVYNAGHHRTTYYQGWKVSE